jgi:hypothetical protein
MKIGILGTGVVGRGHAEKLVSLGHEVMIGTRDPSQTLARPGDEDNDYLSFSTWQKENPAVKLGTFSQTAKFGEIVFDVLKGEIALNVLKSIPNQFLEDKILIDVANPLDFSKGMPPSLLISNTDSLAEQIQKALPETRVVKTFNTINAHLQTHPEEVAKADHTIFLSGNDATAKAEVIKLLQSYGWKDVLDLGDIKSARGMEMFLPLWLEIWGALGTAKFNIKVVRE